VESAAAQPTFELDHGFVAATGIECSAPVIAGGVRMDELEKTGHYDSYARDIELVAELGIRHLRYGIPFHRVNPDGDLFDWSFVDDALDACRRHVLTPIVDLMHFGVPDDIGNYQNPALPDRFRRYADAFAERYGWVRYYTPVNEPLITATFSARLGLWNERLQDERAFIRALLNTVRCVVKPARSSAPADRMQSSSSPTRASTTMRPILRQSKRRSSRTSCASSPSSWPMVCI
jgi:beta-glucosidase/6-phospho-beta-glucosidase/beta-galactosidase